MQFFAMFMTVLLVPLVIRGATSDDMAFLREMLYEAVYWRSALLWFRPQLDNCHVTGVVCYVCI